MPLPGSRLPGSLAWHVLVRLMLRRILLLMSVAVVNVRSEVGDCRSALVRAMATTKSEQVRMLLPQVERGTQEQGPHLCFDDAKTVCFCRVPHAVALRICGGPCWAVGASAFSDDSLDVRPDQVRKNRKDRSAVAVNREPLAEVEQHRN